MGGCYGCLEDVVWAIGLEAGYGSSRTVRIRCNLESRAELRRVYGIDCINRLAACARVEFVPKLIALLQDKSWTVRDAAVTALCAIQHVEAPSVSSALERLLYGKDASAKLLAARVLQHISALSDEQCQQEGEDRNAAATADLLSQTKSIVLSAVKAAGESLKYASKDLQADFEVVFAAIEQNGLALRHASPELRSNRHVVLCAVKQNGLALQHASEELRHDKEVFDIARKQNPSALQFAVEQLRLRAVVQEELCQYDVLMEQMKTIEKCVFARCGSFCSEYLAQREGIAEMMRELAVQLGHADCWIRAITMLDAASAAPKMPQCVGADIAVAAVGLAIRHNHGKFRYSKKEAIVAMHLGRGFTLEDCDKKLLCSAEAYLFKCLAGRLNLPSAACWTTLILDRLELQSGGDEQAKLMQQARAVADQACEIISAHVAATAKTPPLALAVCACGVGLVGLGLLPKESLLLPGDSKLYSTSPIKPPTLLAPLLLPAADAGSEPSELQQGDCMAMRLAAAADCDVDKMRSDFLATLSAMV